MKKHRVFMRYSIASFGDASQLPANSPWITVLYEPVHLYAGQVTRGAQQLVGSVADGAAYMQELALPDLRTYEGGVKPKVTITIKVEPLPPTGTMQGYQVLADLVVDGVRVGGATYSVPLAVARNPATPWQVTGVSEVWH